MSLTLSPITDQQTWTSAFESIDSTSFLHSWAWGEHNQQLGYQVQRVGLYDAAELVGIAQILFITSKKGSFAFIPHGPLVIQPNRYQESLQALVSFLKEQAQQRISFIRIAPLLSDTPEHRQWYQAAGFRPAPLYLHAEHSWILDITPDEETLQANMRKTTRYSIRKSAKDGGVIELRTDPEAVDDFWKLYQVTTTREHFTPFSRSYLLHEFNAFAQTNQAVWLFGKVGNTSEYLAGAMILFTKTSGFYHQGASVHSKIPITYQLQWEAIKEAKRRGCNLYNFWGIAPDENSNHPWAGLTLFKKGFGGTQLDYVPTQDLPLSPAYYLTYAAEKFIRWRRGS